MIIGVTFLICIIGLLLYLLAANPRVNEVGRIMFGVGLFLLLSNGDKVIALAK